MTTDFENWITEELERLLEDLIFQRDRVAETYTERSDLNLEIQKIKKELDKRKMSIERIHTVIVLVLNIGYSIIY